MKKFKKIIIFAVLACMLLSLTSCVDVSELRDQRAYYNDESEQTVHFRNQDYTLYKGEIPYEVNAENMGQVTKKDVPILLASALGNIMHYNDGCTIIMVTDTLYPVSRYYIRNDYIDTFTSIIEEGALADFCYFDYDDNFEMKLITASGDVLDAIIKTISGAPIRDFNVDSVVYSDEFYRCDSTITVYEVAFEIYKDYGTGELFLSSDTGTYAVPAECKDAINKMSPEYKYYGDYEDFEEEYTEDSYI
jgi:hypothetical protein